MARRTALFLKVPPRTTTFSPSSFVLATRTTLVNTFSIIERHRPAIISSGFLPSLCSLIIVLFINTVHLLPKCAGLTELNALLAISLTSMFRLDAKFSRNDPQPDEQASLSIILVITPSLSHIAFIS